MPLKYPVTSRDSVMEEYHGQAIKDPYRWLEDDHSEKTKEWVQEENAVTNEYLSQIPFRNLIRNRLEQIWNYERYGTPFKKGGKYYYFKNDGLQNQSVLYQQESLHGPATIILDPNTFSTDGTVSLGSISFNQKGNLLAYTLSEGGSDWRKIYVKDLDTGALLDDQIEWVKFSGISWSGNGFYYGRFPTPSDSDKLSGQNQYHKLFYHEIGTTQESDILIVEDPSRPQRNFYAMTTEDEHYLCVSASESTSGNALFVEDLKQKGPRITLEKNFDSDLRVIDNVDNHLYI
ncbi:MAG: S9 family peptidase, partial [Saprospiraceae bacterium]|nr:S9 family peptidase [Saprospiraceae bacterium]